MSAINLKLVVSLFAALYSLNLLANTKKEKSVFVQKIVKVELFDIFTYPARVQPQIQVALLSETQGVVAKIYKRLGEKVKANDKVISIRHTDPIYKYQQIDLRAPVDGVISKVLFSEGSQVNRGDRVLTITDPNKIKVLIELSPKDFNFIKPEMTGELIAPSLDKKVPVKISGIAPMVDPATGTVSAELEVISKSSVPLGILGKVLFKANIHSGISLPAHAIVYRGDKSYLRVVAKGNIIKMVVVKTGASRRGKVEIIKGLKEGQLIVERSGRFLSDGDKVVIKKREKEKKI